MSRSSARGPRTASGRSGCARCCASSAIRRRAFPAIHVVGTNGKSTTTRLTEALLLDAGLSVGAYLSPHVRGWSERIRIDGEEADFEAAAARACALPPSRSARRSSRSVTAAALRAFAAAEVDVAVVEAGLGRPA